MTRVPLTKEQLAPIFDDLELMEQRIEQLEQLCRDMYANFGNYAISHDERELLSLMSIFTRRMEELGILEGCYD